MEETKSVSLSPPTSKSVACIVLLAKFARAKNNVQHVLLPYAGDMTNSPDTLFIVVEPDFTIRAEDEAARQQWQEACESEAYGLEAQEDLASCFADEEVKKQIWQTSRHGRQPAENQAGQTSRGLGPATGKKKLRQAAKQPMW